MEITAEEAANEDGRKRRRRTAQERKSDSVPTSPMLTLMAADQVEGDRYPPGARTAVDEDGP